MAYQQYRIGKPGLDDGRKWADMRNSLKRSETEKIEVAAGAPIPPERLQEAAANSGGTV